MHRETRSTLQKLTSLWGMAALAVCLSTAAISSGNAHAQASESASTSDPALVSDPSSASDSTLASGIFRPFSVTLSVTYRGIRAGKSILTLEPQTGSLWRYRSSNRARGLFRLVFPEDISQYSEVLIDQSGIRPQRYVADDGSSDTSRDIELIFDWSQRTIRGSAEQEPVLLRMGEEPVLDPMSVQLALMRDLALGRTPNHYWLADKTQLKRYLYRYDGPSTVEIGGKALATVIWASHREGSDRVTRVWYAKDLGYVPVRAERRRGERLEWSMLAETYELGATQVRGKVTPR